MTYLLLALACSDKDGTDDSSTPELAECTLGQLAPLTVPVDVENEVRVSLSCASDLEQVSSDEGPVDWTVEGETVVLRFTTKRPGQQFLSFQVAGREPMSGSLRAHDNSALFTLRDGLVAIDHGPLGPIFADSKTLLALGETDLIQFDTEGQVVNKVPHSGVCQFGQCFCVAGRESRSCVTPEGTVLWDSLEHGSAEKEVEVDQVLDLMWWETAPRAVGRITEASPDSQGEGGLAMDFASGKSWPLGRLDGDARVFHESVIVQDCDKDDMVLTDLSFEGGKEQSKSPCPFECWPTIWKVSQADLNNDGAPDQIHVFGYEDGEQLGVRLADGEGYGDLVAWSSDAGLSGLQVLGGGRLQWEEGGSVYSGDLLFEEGEVASLSVENPIFHGGAGTHTNALHSIQPPNDPPFVLDATSQLYLAPRRTGRLMAVSNGGQQLERAWKDSQPVWTVDGVEVQVPDGTVGFGFFDEALVTWTPEVLVVDGQAMPVAQDWEILSVVGPANKGLFWVVVASEEGLGRVLVDLGNLDATAASVDKPPATLLVMTTKTNINVNFSFRGVVPPDSGNDGSAPVLIARLPWDTGTDCGSATVVWNEDPVVLATGELEDCSDLAAPASSVSLFGDGSWSVLLTDGSLVSAPDARTVPSADGLVDLFNSNAAAMDLNGDGLGDLVLLTDQGPTLFLSAGDGTSLDTEGLEPPDWTQVTQGNFTTLGVGSQPPPVILSSWGAVLD